MKCPKCNSAKDVVRIIYGEPVDELFEKESKGEVVLGGCLMSNLSPKYQCKKCNYDFGSLEKRKRKKENKY